MTIAGGYWENLQVLPFEWSGAGSRGRGLEQGRSRDREAQAKCCLAGGFAAFRAESLWLSDLNSLFV